MKRSKQKRRFLVCTTVRWVGANGLVTGQPMETVNYLRLAGDDRRGFLAGDMSVGYSSSHSPPTTKTVWVTEISKATKFATAIDAAAVALHVDGWVAKLGIGRTWRRLAPGDYAQ